MLWETVNLFLCWKLLSFTFGLIIGANSSSIFIYINDPAFSSSPLGEAWRDDCLASCASKCQVLNKLCYSFTFNNVTGTCTPGSTLRPVDRSPVVGDMFYYVDYCNLTAGFRLVAYGGIVECLFISKDELDFFSARAVCAAKGAILFIAPTQPRLDLFRHLAENVTKDETWLGLNDLDTENEFYWENGTLLSDEFRTNLYGNRPFDDATYFSVTGEDCCEVGKQGNFFRINDQRCDRTNRFICQLLPESG